MRAKNLASISTKKIGASISTKKIEKEPQEVCKSKPRKNDVPDAVCQQLKELIQEFDSGIDAASFFGIAKVKSIKILPKSLFTFEDFFRVAFRDLTMGNMDIIR